MRVGFGAAVKRPPTQFAWITLYTSIRTASSSNGDELPSTPPPDGMLLAANTKGQTRKPTNVITRPSSTTITETETNPLPQVRRRPKFSFLGDPKDRPARSSLDAHTVPNNTPKPLLPMHASSLTSPQLGGQRLLVENWISTDSMGTVPEEHVKEFIAWLRERLVSSTCTQFLQQLEESVEFQLRCQYTRGIVARKGFKAGDVILSIPLLPECEDTDKTSTTGLMHKSPQWGLVLNSETLQNHSLAAQRRVVPSYSTVESIMNIKKSSFDPTPHPLFVDQMYSALFLACEKADGVGSPLFPYLRLLSPFDDDFIRELHHGVLEPPTHLEYNDHTSRFSHYLRQIHKKWLEEYELAQMMMDSPGELYQEPMGEEEKEEVKKKKKREDRQPPPSMEDLQWAFRIVLSRQRLLPLRYNVEAYEQLCAYSNQRLQRDDENTWTHFIRKMNWAVLDRMFGVVDHTRLHVNDFDPHVIASLVPVLDMIQHPPGGVANTSITVEGIPHSFSGNHTNNTTNNNSNNKEVEGIQQCAVVRAVSDIEEGDELTSLFPRCYSLSYTLYRFGFLPLRRRIDDDADFAKQSVGK